MAIEADTLTPQNIPEYVHDEVATLAEDYRDRSSPCGEGLGVLACTVAVIDDSVEAGRNFVTEQLGLIDEKNRRLYIEADAWKYLAWQGDEHARDTVWGVLESAAGKVRRSREEKGLYDGDTQYLAEETAKIACWLAQKDDRPESLGRARDAAKLAAETGKTTRFLADLYERGDEESFAEELKLFDAEVASATDETISHIRFLHETTLERMGTDAVARGRFDVTDKVLERLTDDYSRALVYAALLGKGKTEGLPFIEEFLGRELPWEGGWTPRITYALARAGYQPAVERLETSTDTDMVGGEEQRLYAKHEVGIAGSREALLAYIEAQGATGYGLYWHLSELARHGLEADAFEMAKARYDQGAETRSAYWVWMCAETPDLTMWQHAYAGAKETRGSDLAAPARALYRLAGLATHEATTS